MTEEAKRIAEKLDRITISRSDLERVCKERLDFGFDSLYFRYAMAIDELRLYKEKESKIEGKYRDFKAWADGQKMHYYTVLESLVHAHEEENNGINR